MYIIKYNYGIFLTHSSQIHKCCASPNTCQCLLICTIFLYILHKKTAEHKAELKVFSHSRLRVRYVLRARGVVTFTAGQPHESYHRRESLGSWTRVDCTETRKIKMSDSQLQELQRIAPHQFCTASD